MIHSEGCFRLRFFGSRELWVPISNLRAPLRSLISSHPISPFLSFTSFYVATTFHSHLPLNMNSTAHTSAEIAGFPLPSHLLGNTLWAFIGRSWFKLVVPIQAKLGDALTFTLLSYLTLWIWLVWAYLFEVREPTTPTTYTATSRSITFSERSTSTISSGSRSASHEPSLMAGTDASAVKKYKLHPGKFEPQELNDKVVHGVLYGNWWGALRTYAAYWVWFSFNRMPILSFPKSPVKPILDVLFAFVANDFFFYFAHKWMHHPSRYRFWHKQHHQFKIANVGATAWNDAIESFLIMVLANTCALAVGMDLFTWLLWIWFQNWNDHHVHCGYRLPTWMNPLNLLVDPVEHDWHHYQYVCILHEIQFPNLLNSPQERRDVRGHKPMGHGVWNRQEIQGLPGPQGREGSQGDGRRSRAAG